MRSLQGTDDGPARIFDPRQNKDDSRRECKPGGQLCDWPELPLRL